MAVCVSVWPLCNNYTLLAFDAAYYVCSLVWEFSVHSGEESTGHIFKHFIPQPHLFAKTDGGVLESFGVVLCPQW